MNEQSEQSQSLRRDMGWILLQAFIVLTIYFVVQWFFFNIAGTRGLFSPENIDGMVLALGFITIVMRLFVLFYMPARMVHALSARLLRQVDDSKSNRTQQDVPECN